MNFFLKGLFLVFITLSYTHQIIALSDVKAVRAGHDHNVTRFVVEMNQPVSYHIFSLPDPNRIVIDLADVNWKIEGSSSTKVGFVTGFRSGRFTEKLSRVVIDLQGPTKIKSVLFLKPSSDKDYRLVLDLVASTQEEFIQQSRKLLAARNKWEESQLPAGERSQQVETYDDEVEIKKPVVQKDSLGKLSVKQQDSGVMPHKMCQGKTPVIVLDAGHGGIDPGAVGLHGTKEKDVTLKAAKIIKGYIEKSGKFKVILTRSGDFYVPLRKRYELARKNKADLFISLHADASANNRLAKGASIYTLSEHASDKEAAALAAKENKSDIIAGLDFGNKSKQVTNILIDLVQRETKNSSSKYANCLIPELNKSILLKQNTHRFAGFAVLKAPDVPSILFEMGYISNCDEEKLLRSEEHLKKIANCVTHSINKFFVQKKM